MSKINTVYLLLGGNVGDTKAVLKTAIKKIEDSIGEVVQQSSLYQTAAWGNENQADFLNQIIIVETILSAEAVLQKALLIEEKMGRVRTVKNASRVIDIDILYFNDELIDAPHLIIPHPQIQNRQFVLIPLLEIAPNFVHPKFKKNTQQLLDICTDQLNVQKI